LGKLKTLRGTGDVGIGCYVMDKRKKNDGLITRIRAKSEEGWE
jgi:hypothetical protein